VAISIELNELSDPEIKQKTEDAIRDCIGARPGEAQHWEVWIRASGSHCQVTVKGPTQTRDRLFFEDGDALAEKIRNWLKSYPFR